MKKCLCALCSFTLLTLGCGRAQEKTKEQFANAPTAASKLCDKTVISRETAILIANGDAVRNYTVSDYDVLVDEQPEGWRVVFKLKNPAWRGGGPDYLIDKNTGKILSATYYK